MSLQQSSPRFSGYIRRLVDEGLVTAQQMQDAVEKAKKNKVSVITYLVESPHFQKTLLITVYLLNIGFFP